MKLFCDALASDKYIPAKYAVGQCPLDQRRSITEFAQVAGWKR